ncbi:MAG: hypothetical protein PF495_17425 [Spirochaetales bacterium]|jgi:hypothetical protein|nr:hypothetical protein [Spirochaetales bacterium]
MHTLPPLPLGGEGWGEGLLKSAVDGFQVEPDYAAVKDIIFALLLRAILRCTLRAALCAFKMLPAF